MSESAPPEREIVDEYLTAVSSLKMSCRSSLPCMDALHMFRSLVDCTAYCLCSHAYVFYASGCTSGLDMPAMMASPQLGFLTQSAAVKSSQASQSLSDAQKGELHQFLSTVHLNMCQCYLKTEKWALARETATKVLQVQPDNPKALFRRGVASLALREIESAAEDLARAHQLCPSDTSIAQQLKIAQKLNDESEAAAERKMRGAFKNMFK